MKYFRFTANTPYAGTTNDYYFAVEDNAATEDFLDECAEEFAYENGETFEYLATGWDEDFETEKDREAYYADCYCDYEEITKEEYEENF